MKTKNEQQFIATDYAGCKYVTAGKQYEIKKQDEFGYIHIVSDIDSVDFDGSMLCAPVGCACHHLNKVGTWRYLTK